MFNNYDTKGNLLINYAIIKYLNFRTHHNICNFLLSLKYWDPSRDMKWFTTITKKCNQLSGSVG